MLKNTEIKDAINYRKKIAELGFEFPTGVVLLPLSLENTTKKEDLIHQREYETVQKLLRARGIEVNSIQNKDKKIPKIINESFEWVGPLIFYSSTILSQHPEILTSSIDILIEYLTKNLRGVPKNDNSVNLTISTETKSGNFKEISYNGPVDGLKDLAEVVRATYEERNG